MDTNIALPHPLSDHPITRESNLARLQAIFADPKVGRVLDTGWEPGQVEWIVPSLEEILGKGPAS